MNLIRERDSTARAKRRGVRSCTSHFTINIWCGGRYREAKKTAGLAGWSVKSMTRIMVVTSFWKGRVKSWELADSCIGLGERRG